MVAMYTGARAAFNCVRSAFLSQPRAAALDGDRLRLDDGVQLMIRVHARVAVPASRPNRRAGMISIGLVSPGIPRPLYALLRMTSHFGCGHIEIAFYEEQDAVIIYGIRNILKANAHRMGCQALLSNLQLTNDNDEIVLLKEVLQALGQYGLKASLADPQECVDLSVDKLLLHPRRRLKTLAMLRRKYARLWTRAAVHHIQSDRKAVGVGIRKRASLVRVR